MKGLTRHLLIPAADLRNRYEEAKALKKEMDNLQEKDTEVQPVPEYVLQNLILMFSLVVGL